jgi:hypothetical protein
VKNSFKLDLCIPMTYLHMQFEPYTYMQTKVRERKLKMSPRRNKHQTMIKFELDQRNPMVNPYIKFEMCATLRI